MKYLLSLVLMLITASALPEEIPIAASVFDGSPNISAKGKEICARAFSDLNNEVNKLNGLMYQMEIHPELGYDIRHEDRMEISVLIVRNLDPMRVAIRKAAYDGEGDICLDKLAQGARLAKQIYEANISYRKVNASKRK